MGAPLVCNPADVYKPQLGYGTPPGFRDEDYVAPLSFTVQANGSLNRGLPVQLDDDVPFILRAISFACIGMGGGGQFTIANALSWLPSLVRITDSHGNPLSDGLIFTLGAWGQVGLIHEEEPAESGTQIAPAGGFPIEPEIECAPGGVLLFDITVSTNAGPATFGITILGETIEFDAFGAVANAYTIQLINPGAANIPLSVAVVGGIHVQVTLQTDGGGALISTFQQIANIINSTPAVRALMSARVFGPNPAQVAAAQAQTNLAGGTASTLVTLQGALIGVKRFPIEECPA